MPSVGQKRTVLCPADCTGGWWSYTCPTYCDYAGGEVTETLIGYTPAVGTGACTTTMTRKCPAAITCADLEYFNQWYNSTQSSLIGGPKYTYL